MRRWITALAGAVLGVATASAVTASAAAANSWHVASQLALGTEDTAVSCPTTTMCVAIEAGELLTSNDGATWTQQTASVSGVAALNDVDCPSATRCYLTATDSAGGPVLIVRNHGIFSTLTAPGTATLPSISCSTMTRCLTTDGTTVFATKDGGATWQPHSLPSIVYTRPAIDCVHATTRCWIVGDRGETPLIERTLNFGSSWTLETAPGSTDGLYDVACPTITTCYGSGADFSDHAVIIRTVNAGDTWTFANVPFQAYALRSVSCPAEDSCTAVGHSPGSTPFVNATTDGQHWSVQSVRQVATDQPAQVSCPSALQCSIVAGGIGYATSNGGALWSDVDLPAAIAAPTELSCPNQHLCVGVGNDAAGRPQAVTSGDFGMTWTPRDMPAGIGTLLAVDCPTAMQCFATAVGTVPGTSRAIAQALYSEDRGVTWTSGHLTDRKVYLRQLTCPSATTCIAGGFDNHSAVKLLRTVDGGHTWAPFAAPGGFYLDGIGCSSVTECVVVTNDAEEAPIAYTTTDLGATYHPHAMPDTYIYDVDCKGGLCVAVGSLSGNGAIDTSPDGGATWEPAAVPAAAQILGKVSCGSATACAASTYDFRQPDGGPMVAGTTNAGDTWHAYPVPARNEEPIAIACARDACIASDVSPTGNPIILAGRA